MNHASFRRNCCLGTLVIVLFLSKGVSASSSPPALSTPENAPPKPELHPPPPPPPRNAESKIVSREEPPQKRPPPPPPRPQQKKRGSSSSDAIVKSPPLPAEKRVEIQAITRITTTNKPERSTLDSQAAVRKNDSEKREPPTSLKSPSTDEAMGRVFETMSPALSRLVEEKKKVQTIQTMPPPPPPPPRRAGVATAKRKPQPSVEELRPLPKLKPDEKAAIETKTPLTTGEEKERIPPMESQQGQPKQQSVGESSTPHNRTEKTSSQNHVQALLEKTAIPSAPSDAKDLAGPKMPEATEISDERKQEAPDPQQPVREVSVTKLDNTIEAQSTIRPNQQTKESSEVQPETVQIPEPSRIPPPLRTMPAPILPKTRINSDRRSNSATYGARAPPMLHQQQNGGTQPYEQRAQQQFASQHANVPSCPQNVRYRRTEGMRQPLPPQPQKPPNQYARRPASNSAGSAPVLQSLWSRVEKGLDGLANFEDAITGRAQKLVSTAVPIKSIRPQQASKQRARSSVPSQPRPKSQPKRGPTTESLAGPQLRWQNQKEQNQKRRISETGRAGFTDTGSAQPSVSIYQFKSLSPLLNDQDTSSSSKLTTFKRNEPLSEKARKLMPANGGASTPNDDGNNIAWSYSGQSRHSTSPSIQTNLSKSEGDTTPNVTPDGLNSIQRGSEAGGVQRGSAPQRPNSELQQQGSGDSQVRSPFPGSVQRGPPNTASITPGQRGRPANWPQGQAMQRGPPLSSSASSQSSGRAPRPIAAMAATQVSRPRIYPDDDDDERPSPISRLLGSVPVPHLGKLFRFRRKHSSYSTFDAWDAEDEDAKQSSGLFGLFRRRRDSAKAISKVVPKKQAASNQGGVTKPVQTLMDRSNNGKSASLLTADDKKRIRGMGKSRAVLDVVSLGFFLVGIRQLQGLENIPFPDSVAELGSLTLPHLLSALVSSMDTWAPLAFACAILTVVTNSLLFNDRILWKATEVAAAAESEASYGRLFVRLVLSTPIDRDLPDKVYKAASLQVMALADLSRLRSFITFSISTILLTTVAFIRPLVLTIIGSIIHIVTLREWRTWPIPTDLISANIKDTIGGVGHEMKSLMGIELKGAGHHPVQFAFKASILAALLAVAFLPALVYRRATEVKGDIDDEDSDEAVQLLTERLSNLGASSAGRLGLLSKNGWMEGVVERWSLLKDEYSTNDGDVLVGPLFRRAGYYFISWCLLAAPMLLFGLLLGTPMTGWSSAQMPRWESMLEVSVLLLFANALLSRAIAKAIESTSMRSEVAGFLKSVSGASGEMVRHSVAPQPFASSPNPTAGLLVRDLWAAHEVKRAWAIRAAHLSCQNGEVLVVLGDDGAGKSRLLTTLAESIVSPPRGALTARIQRGSVALGGIDVTKWDRNQLRKRVGLLLNDVNAMSNMAGIWSGLTLEEILEPGDGLKLADPAHTSSAMEKSCMIRALKLTGLYWSLLPRLPAKLSSVLTANEEDLRPSSIRPRYHVLSPSEWSKLMLAKLLAQALYDNENSSGSSDKVDNSLVGSLFLLDDATLLLSEIEEAKLLRDLRRTGVATVLTSNKWATGRLADCIVVMKDGTIIESGSHDELLSRGPHQSVYAAKWHAMTAY